MGVLTARAALASVLATAVLAVVVGNANSAETGKPVVRLVPGQADYGTVEVHGVGAGEFNPRLWEAGKLNLLPDRRSPLLEPQREGPYRNIYAPSAVEMDDGWRVFYAAWDGVHTPNDRVYSVFTRDFLDFSGRRTVIEHGDFIHCCNVNGQRLPDGSYRLMCTVYPDRNGQNKPAVFTSPDGVRWNGARAPYPAGQSDIITMEGYAEFADADINGMNVSLFEDGAYRIYFNNFKDFGKVFRATSSDGKHFRFEGVALEKAACVNDVKKLVSSDGAWYLMGLHMNGDTLWYALSRDGMRFRQAQELAKNLGDDDRYIVAIGWVVRKNRVLGFLYGAGAIRELCLNRVFARWLQRKVVFITSDGTRYEPTGSLGPDRQVIEIPWGRSLEGHFEVYAEDGATLLAKCKATLVPGAAYTLAE